MVKHIIFIIFVGIFGLVENSWGKSAMDYFNEARKQPEAQEQVRLLTIAIGLNPKMVGAYHYRADAYKNLRRFQEALMDYTTTINLRPQEAFRYYARGLTYEELEDYSQAIIDFTKAISLKADYDEFYLHRAGCYNALNKYEQAIKDYKKYLEKHELTSELAVEMARINIDAYHYKQAEELLTEAENKGEDSAKFHYLKGRVYAGQSRWDEAISSYSKALHRDVNYAQAYRYRANAFNEIENYEDCVADYTALLSLQPEAIFYNRRGLIQERLNKFVDAEADYTRAIELNPKWAIAFNNRGFVRMRLKKMDDAKQDLEKALKLDGTTPTAYVNLAGWYWTVKKDKKNTYKNIDKAVQLNLKDVDSLYDEDKKGWLFKGINQTSTFKVLLYK